MKRPRDFPTDLTGAKARPVRLPVATEAEVQKACLAILAARSILAWRSNSRVFKVAGKGGRERLMRAGLGKGSSDIIGMLSDGRFLAIEVKREGQKPTAEQIAWMTLINRQGGLAFWVDRIDRLESMLFQIETARRKGRRLTVEIWEDSTLYLGYAPES